MNHRAFDIPGYNESTSIEIYPGMVPEDFHLQRTQEGFYRKWDNTRDWNSAWQVQNLGLADLIDIAQEPGVTNYNFGYNEGSTFPKIKFIRDLDRPEQYAYDKDGNYIDQMDYSNEILVKFCRKLRQLDKPNDFNILLKNMKNKSIEQNREVIDSLIGEIQTLQKDIALHDTQSRELYKLDTHNTAKKQVNAINKAITNVKNSGNISVNLV